MLCLVLNRIVPGSMRLGLLLLTGSSGGEGSTRGLLLADFARESMLVRSSRRPVIAINKDLFNSEGLGGHFPSHQGEVASVLRPAYCFDAEVWRLSGNAHLKGLLIGL